MGLYDDGVLDLARPASSDAVAAKRAAASNAHAHWGSTHHTTHGGGAAPLRKRNPATPATAAGSLSRTFSRRGQIPTSAQRNGAVLAFPLPARVVLRRPRC